MSDESSTPKELAYDSLIHPLMEKIIEICKEHKIAMVADFCLDFNEEEDCPLHCTTALLSEEFSPAEKQLKAWEHLKPKKPDFFALTITTHTDK